MPYSQTVINNTRRHNSRKLLELDPWTRDKAVTIIGEIASTYGVLMYITSGLRSFQNQNRLYNEGKTKTPGGRSWHNYGRAWDMVPLLEDGSSASAAGMVTPDQWERLGKIAEKYGVTWGGRFSDYDPVHFADKRGQRIEDLITSHSPGSVNQIPSLNTWKQGSNLLPVAVVILGVVVALKFIK